MSESAQKTLRIAEIRKHGEEVALLRAEIDRLTTRLAEQQIAAVDENEQQWPPDGDDQDSYRVLHGNTPARNPSLTA